jgi:hypothetical protein
MENIEEVRANVPEGLTRAEAFFYQNAGFSQGNESVQEAIVRCAKELARAEAWAQEVNVIYRWEDDDEPAEYQDETGEWYSSPAVVCLAKLHGEVIASLGGIIESKNNRQAQDYCRIVQAELAEEGREGLLDLARQYLVKADLFRSDYDRF